MQITCSNPNCENLILLTTAERTGGQCMPCVQAAARKEEEKYIRNNRRDINEFEGITNRVEIIQRIHRQRKWDPLVNWIPYPLPVDQLYRELNDQQQVELAKHAAELIGTEHMSESESIVQGLALWTNADLSGVAKRSAQEGVHPPYLMFAHAPTDLRDDLIGMLGSMDDYPGNVLSALAWIGDSVVVELFASWRCDPPAWADRLYIPPEQYAQEAGWELGPDDQRRNLYFDRCVSLQRGSSEDESAFYFARLRSESCPWCEGRLSDLFNVKLAIVDGTSSGENVTVTTCQRCTAFGTVFSEVGADGIAQWSAQNRRPEYLPGDIATWDLIAENFLCLGEPRGSSFPLDWGSSSGLGASQVGGRPAWVQDFAYPKCPSCVKTMPFLAQMDCTEFDEIGEGCFYAFLCLDCHTTATVYQQT